MASIDSKPVSGPMNVLIAVTVLVSCTTSIVPNVIINPVIANVITSYPALAPWSDWIISSTAVAFMLAAIVTGWLERILPKKLLVTIGTVLFAIGGLMMIPDVSATFFIASRVILGFGGGIAMTIAPSLITSLYEGNKRTTMMGFKSGTETLCQLAFGVLAGFIALVSWHNAGYLYLVFALLVFMQIFFLPNVKSDKEEQKARMGDTVKESMGPVPILILILSFIGVITIMVIPFTLSLFMVQEGLGTSATVGLVNAAMAIVGFLFSFLFTPFYSLFRRWTLPLAYAAEAVAFCCIAFAHSTTLIIVGMFLFGFCTGLSNPYCFSWMSLAAPVSRMTQAMGLMLFAVLGAQFIAPFYRAFLQNGLGLDFRGQYLVTAAVLAVLAVSVFIGFTVKGKVLVEKYDLVKKAA